MNTIIRSALFLLFVVVIVAFNPPPPDCSFYLTYQGGGQFLTVITDQNGNTITGGSISYRCGQNHLKQNYPYGICIECPPTSTQTFTGTLTEQPSNAVIVTGSVTCVPTGKGLNYVSCVTPPPTYTIPANNKFTLTFKVGARVLTPTVSKVSGDPHFDGFKGQDFDFQGEKGKIFHIFSDAQSSINALFSDPTHRKHILYMTTFGLKFSDLSIVVNANQSNGLIIANGVPITLLQDTEVKLSDCVYALYRTTKRESIQIQSNHHTYDISLVLGKYLNLEIKIKNDDLQELGGILGLTENTNFTISAYSKSDFEESSLLSTQSKYNKYTASDLACTKTDPVSTLSPKQIRPVMVARVAHSVLEEVFYTTDM